MPNVAERAATALTPFYWHTFSLDAAVSSRETSVRVNYFFFLFWCRFLMAVSAELVYLVKRA